MLRRGFLVVGPSSEVAEVATEEGILVAGGLVLRLSQWGCRKGTYPSPRPLRLKVKLLGLPILLCK